MLTGRGYVRRVTQAVLAACLLLESIAAAPASAGPAATYIPSSGPYVDDRKITIRKAADVSAKRGAIIRFIWGKGGFPRGMLPSKILRDVPSPVLGLVNLERVDSLHLQMAPGLVGMSHLFIPKKKEGKEVVVLHLGHSDNCTFNDGFAGEPDTGMRSAISAFVAAGYPVVAVYMPQITPEDCRWRHDTIFHKTTTGNPLKFFLEPTLASLNHVEKSYPQYKTFTMIGLSGGGWTTVLYAAIDPRIKVSIPVAGTLPLYFSHEGYGYDVEQRLDSFYRLAGYLDLYLLGIAGNGRKQIQILNRQDDCCFGERQHDPTWTGLAFEPAVREYEGRVKQVAETLGFGAFQVVIDDKADGHKISAYALHNVILPEVRRAAAKGAVK